MIQPLIRKADCSPLQGITVIQVFTDELVSCLDSIYGQDAFGIQLNMRGMRHGYQIILDVKGTSLGLDVQEDNNYTASTAIVPVIPTDVRQVGQVVVLACQDTGSAIQVACSIKNAQTGTYTYESNWIQKFKDYDRIIGVIPLIVGYGSGSDARFSSGAFTISIENDQMGTPVVDFVDPTKPANQPCYPQAQQLTINETSNISYVQENIGNGFVFLKATTA